jgi:hypothetical protein
MNDSALETRIADFDDPRIAELLNRHAAVKGMRWMPSDRAARTSS